MMYQIYDLICWPAFLGFGLVALTNRNWALMRCVLIMAAGQGLVDIWAGHFAPKVWKGQPSALLFAIYLASAWGLSIRPSGKLCSIMAALCIWGVAFSAMHQVFYWTKATDSLYFTANLAIGWLSFLVMAGGASGERGRRVVSWFVRTPSSLANQADIERLA